VKLILSKDNTAGKSRNVEIAHLLSTKSVIFPQCLA